MHIYQQVQEQCYINFFTILAWQVSLTRANTKQCYIIRISHLLTFSIYINQSIMRIFGHHVVSRNNCDVYTPWLYCGMSYSPGIVCPIVRTNGQPHREGFVHSVLFVQFWLPSQSSFKLSVASLWCMEIIVYQIDKLLLHNTKEGLK